MRQKAFIPILIIIFLAVIGVVGVYFFGIRKVNILSTPTQIPSNTPQATTGIENENLLVPVGIGAQFYADSNVKALLRPNDILLLPVIRKKADEPITSERLRSALDIFNGLDTGRSGVEKNILFSSVDDLRNYVKLLPSDITMVSYDMEGGMTPAIEINDPVGSVQKFADIVHKAGKKMGFGPTHSIYDGMEKRGNLAEALKYIDKIAYQGQNVLRVMSEEEFINLIQKKYSFIQNANRVNGSNAKLYLQLWNPQQPPDTMVRIFSKLSGLGIIDYAGTGGLISASDVITVLDGLR